MIFINRKGGRVSAGEGEIVSLIHSRRKITELSKVIEKNDKA